MKRVIGLLALVAALSAHAQVRTYTDNASKTFVVGLDSYFFGASGALDFQLGGASRQAAVENGTVKVDGALLEDGSGDTVIGVHDFTGDRTPELVVARRNGDTLSANVYAFSQGAWKKIGRIGAAGCTEIRVFRQVFSIRSGEALYSWTWHAPKFDFKASDGSADPTPGL